MSRHKRITFAGLLDDIGYRIAKRTGEFYMTEAEVVVTEQSAHDEKRNRMAAHAERVSRRLRG